MGDVKKALQKIRTNGILSLKEVQLVLKYWGFIERPGKGSHQNWKHPSKPKILTIAVHGKEVPHYIGRELRKMIEDLEK